MRNSDAEIAVVGVGMWGAATLWRLAERGHDVVGIDRFEPGHGFGSSVGGSRMFRLTCLEHPGLVPLARRSLELWRRLEHDSGAGLLNQSGALLIGPPHGHIVGGTLRSARTHDITVETLSRTDIHARFPGHAGLSEDEIAIWEPSAGLLRAEDSVRAAAAAAVRAGATLMTDTRVQTIEPAGDGVIVHTPTGTLRVRRVVLTVGSWLSSFTTTLPLRTVRFPVTWFEPRSDTTLFELERLPVFMRELPDGTVLWGNGSESGNPVKLGIEVHGRTPAPFDPEVPHRTILRADWRAVADRLPTYLPGLHPEPSQVAVSMITRTPDGQFILGHLDGDRRIIVAGGCNGHGFKHATGIGELLADFAEDETPRYPVEFTAAGRPWIDVMP